MSICIVCYILVETNTSHTIIVIYKHSLLETIGKIKQSNKTSVDDMLTLTFTLSLYASIPHMYYNEPIAFGFMHQKSSFCWYFRLFKRIVWFRTAAIEFHYYRTNWSYCVCSFCCNYVQREYEKITLTLHSLVLNFSKLNPNFDSVQMIKHWCIRNMEVSGDSVLVSVLLNTATDELFALRHQPEDIFEFNISKRNFT